MSAFDLQIEDFDIQIEDEPAKPKRKPGKVDTSRGGAFVRGIAQGGSMGFGDELAGALGAAASSVGLLDNKENLSFGDAYRQYRDQARESDRLAEAKHGGAYIAGQVVGGIATAPALPGGAVSTLGKAAATGAGYGAVAGLGGSKADLTRGEVDQAAIDTGIGAGVGLAAGAVGHGIVKGAGKAASAIRARVGGEAGRVEHAARGVAEKVAQSADEPSLIGSGETVRSAAAKGRALVDEWSSMLPEPFHLRPSQLTGDPAAALAESRVAQFPKTMQRAQALRAKQLEQVGSVADAYIDRVASDPTKLGRADVTGAVGQAVKTNIKAIYENTSRTAGPIYDAFEAAGGGVMYAPIRGRIADVLSDAGVNTNQVTGKLRQVLDKYDKSGAGGGISIKEANDVRKAMNAVIARESQALDGVDMTVQGAIAKKIRGVIDNAFDEAASTENSGPAIALLRKANAIWASGQKAADEASTDAVLRIIDRVAPGSNLESLPRQMLTMEEGQAAGIFRILRASGEGNDAADQLLAQMLDEIMVKAGKVPRGGAGPIAPGSYEISPYGALEGLKKALPALRAGYAGNGKAEFAINRLSHLMQRTSFGPGLQGAQTAPVIADALGAAVEQAADATIGRAPTAAAKSAMGWAERLTGNAEMAAKAATSIDGINAFSDALAMMLGAKQGKPISEKAARGFMTAISRLGIDKIQSAVSPDRFTTTDTYGATASLD